MELWVIEIFSRIFYLFVQHYIQKVKKATNIKDEDDEKQGGKLG